MSVASIGARPHLAAPSPAAPVEASARPLRAGTGSLAPPARAFALVLAGTSASAAPIEPRFAEGDPLHTATVGQAAAVDHSHHHGHHGVHGMVMFGSGDSLLLSHIPMFAPPHDRQVLVSASAPALAGRTFSDGTFTFRPDAFSLDALLGGELKTIRGTVFSGNFESGGRPIAEDVELTVNQIPLAKPLDPAGPAPESLTYHLIASGENAFLVHEIARAPDFDQVLQISLEDSGLTAEELAAGVKVIVPDRDSDVAARLLPGEQVKALVVPSGKELTLTVGKELSVLVGPDFVAGP